MRITRAISVRQPCVENILAGVQECESRSQPTNIRGRVYLYASKTPADLSIWRETNFEPGDLPTGKILGTVEIVDCCYLDGSFRYQLRIDLCPDSGYRSYKRRVAHTTFCPLCGAFDSVRLTV
jgi:hypothetical protein